MTAHPDLEAAHLLARRQTLIETHLEGLGPEPAFLDALDLEEQHQLLDLCCGTGSFLAALAAAGHTGELVGLDRSEALLQAARARHPDVRFVLGDALNAPFPSESFDRISLRFALPHLSPRFAALSEIARLLRQGGRVAALHGTAGHLEEFWQVLHRAMHAHPRLRDHALPPPAQPACDAPAAFGPFRAVERRVLEDAVWLTPEESTVLLGSYLPALELPQAALPALRQRYLEEVAGELRGEKWRLTARWELWSARR
ncbi:SAM-dependent methyltransferase [Deinobacterium chartae]|uniref:SAM-dependent methyltransferase n=1 Tax=Deinobacterium chartae TaxID=521158 RepID=A0A841HXB7_9DEIO|nr:methyltransferase domain-containing protein [Deinobacterium chartae]MBB6097556.1 SAM-dependent methyltransferase [Deinobacterium chartae]